VILTTAENTVIDTGLAEIKVTIIAGTAVVVNIGDCLGAVITINGENADCGRSWAFIVAITNSTLSLIGQASELSEPSVTSSGTSGDWNLRARAGVHLGSIPSRVIPNRVESLNVSLCVIARERVDEGRWGVVAKSWVVDEEFLKSTLDLGNWTWIDGLLRICDIRWCLWNWDGCLGWLGKALECRLLFHRANRAWLLILYSSRLWHDRLLILNSDLETKLELGLSRTVELLIDRCVVWVEDNKCCGTVGVTFEDGLGGRWDGKKEAKL
jgi:hypothetical protein